MAQPTPYSPTTNFAQEEANSVSGRSTLRNTALDAELAALSTTLSQVLANLSTIQRDDGEIRDGRVKLHTLAADVRAILATGDASIGGAWATATAYAAKTIVTQSGDTYLCLEAHTSGVFATDLAAGKWGLLNGLSAADLVSTAGGLGASLVGVQDAGGNFAASGLEAVLAEIAASLSTNAAAAAAADAKALAAQILADNRLYDVAQKTGCAVNGADVTAEIQASIGQAAPLFFKAGTFGVDSDLSITDIQIWAGAGGDRTKIRGITGNEKISINGGGLIVVGIEFEHMAEVFYDAGSIVVLDVRECVFDDVDGPFGTSAVANSVAKLVFSRNLIENSRNGLVVQVNNLDDAEVTFNKIRNIASTAVQASGIRLGNDLYEALSVSVNRQRYRVLGNLVDTVDTSNVTSSARAFGICCFGDYHQMLCNDVRRISTSGRGLGAEGIYSKGRQVLIGFNNTVDAVQSVQGHITLKGVDRADTANGTQGYNKICIANTCLTTAAGNGGWGIWSQTGETLIALNLCEGMKTDTAAGITEAGAIGLSDVTKENVLVTMNTARDLRGNYGYLCSSAGRHIEFFRNTLDGCTDDEAGSTTRAFAVTGQATGPIDGISFVRNRIRVPATNSTSELSALYFSQSVANTRITIDGNEVELADDVATLYAVRFAGTTAPAEGVTITNNDLTQSGASAANLIFFEPSAAPKNVKLDANKYPVVQFAGAGTIDLLQINLANERAYGLTGKVKVEEDTTLTDAAYYEVHGLVTRTAAGSAALSASSQSVVLESAGAGGLNAAFAVGANRAILRGTGISARTFNWTYDLSMM